MSEAPFSSGTPPHGKPPQLSSRWQERLTTSVGPTRSLLTGVALVALLTPAFPPHPLSTRPPSRRNIARAATTTWRKRRSRPHRAHLQSRGPREFFSMGQRPRPFQTGEMPPKENKKSARTPELAAFLQSLATTLTTAEKETVAREGRATQRRLNGYEYENALRDLLSAPWLQVKAQFRRRRGRALQ